MSDVSPIAEAPAQQGRPVHYNLCAGINMTADRTLAGVRGSSAGALAAFIEGAAMLVLNRQVCKWSAAASMRMQVEQ
jgi:hypothetical protein